MCCELTVHTWKCTFFSILPLQVNYKSGFWKVVFRSPDRLQVDQIWSFMGFSILAIDPVKCPKSLSHVPNFALPINTSSWKSGTFHTAEYKSWLQVPCLSLLKTMKKKSKCMVHNDSNATVVSGIFLPAPPPNFQECLMHNLLIF